MKIAIDVHYRQKNAKIVAVIFEDWADEVAKQFIVKYMDVAEEYVPGQFYKRELPCILEILKQVDLKRFDCVIVDGFVYLDDQLSPGLGAHLYHQLKEKIPVIGVAKSNFLKNKKCSVEVLRGESVRPLFVTAAGMDLSKAAKAIKGMHGEFRMPALLQQLDTQTKEA